MEHQHVQARQQRAGAQPGRPARPGRRRQASRPSAWAGQLWQGLVRGLQPQCLRPRQPAAGREGSGA
eukprot:12769640-Alexandrium_andersonii.AAC.1